MHCLIILTYLVLASAEDSDVIHTHAGHSDVDRPLRREPDKEPEKPSEKPTEKPQETTVEPVFPTEEDVIFVPNEKKVLRNEDYYKKENNLKLDNLGDGTESSKDTVFISGKNNENVEQPIKHQNKEEVHGDVIRLGKEKHGDVKTKKKLNCRNVICENNVGYICGRRVDDGKTKYRMFLNECYLRKVNCGFKNENNRYTEVGMENCTNVDFQTSAKQYTDRQNVHLYADASVEVRKETRRSFISRRSSSKGVDGQPCSHVCPVSCTEDYDPQCALSSSGQRKVFVNHCKLDYNSCLHGSVWYRRPLSECVGGKKADMQQNRGFIGWMQRVGIVDRKGRIAIH